MSRCVVVFFLMSAIVLAMRPSEWEEFKVNFGRFLQINFFRNISVNQSDELGVTLLLFENIFISSFSIFHSQKEHSKYYDTPAKEQHHFRIFLNHKHRIDAHNIHYENGVVPFKMGLNKHSDLPHEEIIEIISINQQPQ